MIGLIPLGVFLIWLVSRDNNPKRSKYEGGRPKLTLAGPREATIGHEFSLRYSFESNSVPDTALRVQCDPRPSAAVVKGPRNGAVLIRGTRTGLLHVHLTAQTHTGTVQSNTVAVQIAPDSRVVPKSDKSGAFEGPGAASSIGLRGKKERVEPIRKHGNAADAPGFTRRIGRLIDMMFDATVGESLVAKESLVALGQPAFPTIFNRMLTVRKSLAGDGSITDKMQLLNLRLADEVLRDILPDKNTSPGSIGLGSSNRHVDYVLAFHRKRWLAHRSR